MSYRNHIIPDIPSTPRNNDENIWGFVRGISILSQHRGDNADLCLYGGAILMLFDLMGMYTRCRRLVVFEFPEIRHVFTVTDQTYGEVCTVPFNDKCRSNDD